MTEHELQVVAKDEKFASAVSHSITPTGRNTFSSALSTTVSQRQQNSSVTTAPGITVRKDEDNRTTRDSDAIAASGGQPYMFYDFVEVEDAQVLSVCACVRVCTMSVCACMMVVYLYT